MSNHIFLGFTVDFRYFFLSGTHFCFVDNTYDCQKFVVVHISKNYFDSINIYHSLNKTFIKNHNLFPIGQMGNMKACFKILNNFYRKFIKIYSFYSIYY